MADGFGLTRTEFKVIMESLELELMLSQKEMAELSNKLFELLDTDKNELVDAMEFLGEHLDYFVAELRIRCSK